MLKFLLKLILLPFQIILGAVFFPFVLIWSLLKALFSKSTITKTGKLVRPSFWARLGQVLLLIIVALVFIPMWLGAYLTAGALIANQLGFISQSTLISGTGSMYPTFPKGEGKDPQALSQQIVSTQGMFPYPNGLVILGKRYFGHEIGHGDIVVIESDTVRQKSQELYGEPSGWVKRVIALAGDTLELRDGSVYRNGEPISEPYIARARSTFGQTFLQECKVVTVPPNSVFVMGDNRKGSGDSREIGFISLADITHALPLAKQPPELKQYWRDTSTDQTETARIKLDRTAYLAELNRLRQEAGIPALKYQPKLEQSAEKRGAAILKYDDYSFEATKSGYTMKRAMQEVGYSNIVTGEVPTPGYFEADELLENQFEFAAAKEFLLDKRFQEVGIGEVQSQINGCPTHIIVQHLAGYQPPNYEAEVVSSWRQALNNLRDIQPGWAKLTENPEFYDPHRADVDRLNQIIATRIANLTRIVAKMEANQWLNAEEEALVDGDEALSREQRALADKLNNL